MSIDEPNEPALHLCERELLGLDHAAVGGALALRWQLPASLVVCIACHYEPERAESHALEVALVHIANSVAVLAEVESEEMEDAPPIHPMAWQVTGLHSEAALRVAVAAERAVDEIKHLFQLPGLH